MAAKKSTYTGNCLKNTICFRFSYDLYDLMTDLSSNQEALKNLFIFLFPKIRLAHH